MENNQSELVTKINELLAESDLAHLRFRKMELTPVKDENLYKAQNLEILPLAGCIVYMDGVPTYVDPCPDE